MNHPRAERSNGFDRRTLLRAGGVSLLGGAVLSACAADFGGDTAPGRVGLADEGTPLPDGVVDDVVLMRTMQSLEHTVVAGLSAMADAGMFSAAQSTYIDRFISDHVEASGALGAIIEAGGGEQFACPNEWVMSRYVEPILAAVEGTDDEVRDVRAISHALETMLAHSYQHVVGLLDAPAHRRAAMVQGAAASRRSATLAMQSSAALHGYVGPELAGTPESTPDGFPIPYAVPSTFGRVDQIELVVGAVDDEGSRFSTLLQTPAENTFVYAYQSC
jgi:hypothetical protein